MAGPLIHERDQPAWQRINALFERHGLPAPPWRLRDELVAHLSAYDDARERLETEVRRQTMLGDPRDCVHVPTE